MTQEKAVSQEFIPQEILANLPVEFEDQLRKEVSKGRNKIMETHFQPDHNESDDRHR